MIRAKEISSATHLFQGSTVSALFCSEYSPLCRIFEDVFLLLLSIGRLPLIPCRTAESSILTYDNNDESVLLTHIKMDEFSDKICEERR